MLDFGMATQFPQKPFLCTDVATKHNGSRYFTYSFKLCSQHAQTNRGYSLFLLHDGGQKEAPGYDRNSSKDPFIVSFRFTLSASSFDILMWNTVNVCPPIEFESSSFFLSCHHRNSFGRVQICGVSRSFMRGAVQVSSHFMVKTPQEALRLAGALQPPTGYTRIRRVRSVSLIYSTYSRTRYMNYSFLMSFYIFIVPTHF